MNGQAQAAAQLCDVVRVIAPRGARDVGLRIGWTAEGAPRVEAVGSKAAGASWAALLGLDAAEYLGLVHGALEQMELPQRELPDEGIGAAEPDVGVAWVGDGAVVTWGERTVEIPGSVLARMVFAPELLEALLAAGPELRAWHEAFAVGLRGHDEAKWDAATGELRLGRGVLPWRTFPARRIGTFGLGDGVFRWAWADPEIARSLAISREELTVLGPLAVARTPWFPCDEAFAARLSGWIAMRLGGRGLYPLSEGQQTIAFHSVQVR